MDEALRVLLAADAKALKRVASSRSSLSRDRDVADAASTLRALALDQSNLDFVLDACLANSRACANNALVLLAMCAGDFAVARAMGDALVTRVRGARNDAALAACFGIETIARGVDDVASVFDLSDALRALGRCAEAGSGKPTRLSAAAVDAFAALGGGGARTSRDSNVGETLMSSVEALERVIALVEEWAPSSAGCGVFRESCARARERLEVARTKRRRDDVDLGDADATERGKAAKIRLVVRAWRDWAPALVTLKSRKDEKEMLTAVDEALAAVSEMVHSDDAAAGDGVAHALITVGLNLGRLGIDHSDREVFTSMVSEEGSRALDEMLRERTGSALLPALRCSNVIAQSVAAVLIRVTVAPEHLGWTEQSESLLSAVLPLVEEDGKIISLGFTRLVADLATRNPSDDSLLRLLQLCGGSARSAKVSALNVLSEVLRLGRSMSEEMLKAVTRMTLSRLNDKDLESRKAATVLFSRLQPSVALPTLIRLLISKDAEERSAAGDAVVSMLRGQRSTTEALEAYLLALSSFGQGTATNNEDGKLQADAISRGVKLLKRFAPTVPTNEWPEVVQTIINAVLRSPSSTALHQVVLTLAPWIGVPPMSRCVIELCSAALLEQSENKNGDEADIFNRLAPLLMLRALPLGAFDDTDCDTRDIQTCLKHRMLNIRGEYEEVRRVCSDLFGRLPREIIESQLFSEIHVAYSGAKASRDDLARVRTCMFCCNSALALRGDDALSEAYKDELRNLAVDLLTWNAPPEDVDVSKAHMGAMETLATLIVTEIESSKDVTTAPSRISSALLEPKTSALMADDARIVASGRALIVEVDEHEGATSTVEGWKLKHTSRASHPTLRGVLHLACAKNDDAPKWCESIENRDLRLRLAMMNVIIATARRPMTLNASMLVDECLPPLVSCAARRGEPDIRAAALQALMMVFHGGKSEAIVSHAVPLMRTVTAILRDHAAGDIVRMGATRVATALLAGEENVLKEVEPHLEALREALEIAARVAVDSEVSALAAKLAGCMTA